ncbi:MAG: hypothetical protein HY554_00610 [Elusimicrobia bacterium]|nr:hypothetical protein [Elusimicrobiota bacterium]
MKSAIFMIAVSALTAPRAWADLSDSGALTVGQGAAIVGTAAVQGNAFSVGGSTFTVTGGKVGIGTTGPVEKLDIVGAASSPSGSRVGGIFSVADDMSSNAAILQMGIDSSGNGWIDTSKPNTGVKSLYLNALGGKVGIGTSSPGAKLDVSLASGSTYYYFGICPTPTTGDVCEFAVANSVVSGSSFTIAHGNWAGGSSTDSGANCTVHSMAAGDSNRNGVIQFRVGYGPTVTTYVDSTTNLTLTAGVTGDRLEVVPTGAGGQTIRVHHLDRVAGLARRTDERPGRSGSA